MSLTEAVSWFSLAIMIIMALPLGLIFARILTDKNFPLLHITVCLKHRLAFPFSVNVLFTLKRENTVVNNGSQLCQKSFYPTLDKEPF